MRIVRTACALAGCLLVVFSLAKSVSAQSPMLHCTAAHCKLTPANTPLFTLENAVPGSTYQTITTVRNSRKDACALTLSLEPSNNNPTLPLESIFLAAVSGRDQQYLGNVVQGKAQATITAASLQSTPHVFGYITPQETRDFVWHATINPELGNEYQGTKTTLSLFFHVRCDEPSAILPSPVPTPSPTVVAVQKNPTATTTTSNDTNIPGATPNNPSVLGAQTQHTSCPAKETGELAASWIEKRRASITWKAPQDTVIIAFQNNKTRAVFRHSAVTKNPYTIPHLDDQQQYWFWLEQGGEECPETPISKATLLGVIEPPPENSQKKAHKVLGTTAEIESNTPNNPPPKPALLTPPLDFVEEVIWLELLFLLGLLLLVFLVRIKRKKSHKHSSDRH